MDPQRAATLTEEYLSGLTMREVAARHGINPRTVARALRQEGAQTRSPAERQGLPPIEEWVRLHTAGSATAEIAARYGVKEARVRERLRQRGVPLPRPSRPQPRKRSRDEVETLLERYIQGETLTAIGLELGVTKTRVQQILRDSGAPLDSLTPLHRAARNRLHEQADRGLLEQMLARDPALTVRDLARATGMPPGRVKRLLAPESPARRLRPTRSAEEQEPSVLAAVRLYARESGVPRGGPLSGPAYDAWAAARGLPSRAALVRRFGTWAEATRLAGFAPTVTPRRDYRRISHAEAIVTVAAYVAHEREQGRPPSSTRYPAWAKQHDAPSLAGLTRLWRWSELVDEALA